MRTGLMSILLPLAACTAGAPADPPDPIDSPVLAVAAGLDTSRFATVVDVRGPGVRSLPGAIGVDPYATASYSPGEAAAEAAARLQAAWVQAGVRGPVLVVGTASDPWGADGYAWWQLRAGGWEAAVLDGGVEAWEAAGGATAAAGSPGGHGEIPDAPAPEWIATTEDVKRASETGAVILDVRTRGEHDAGHIPGARLWPHEDVYGADRKIQAEAELEGALAELGVEGDDPLITSCAVGVRAAHEAMVLAALGRPVRSYWGSWSAWSAER